MTNDHLWVCAEFADAQDVARLMSQRDVGSVLVVDEKGSLAGIVTDRDIVCRLVARGRSPETPIRAIMSCPVHTVLEDAPLADVRARMKEYRIRRVAVVDHLHKLVGVISLGDIARRCHGPVRKHAVAEALHVVSTD